VRGVADQEDAPRREAIGDRGAELPAPGRDQLDLDVVAADRPAHQRAQRGLVALLVVGEHQEPAAIAVRRQHALQAGLIELELADPGLEVSIELRAEQDAADHVHEAVAAAADPERLPDRAPVAVGGDHVTGAHGVLGPVARANDGRDALAVLPERHELGAHPELGAELDGLLAQDLLEPVLRDRRAGAR
jgi:hypothetical protein